MIRMTEPKKLNIAIDRTLTAYIPWDEILPMIKKHLSENYDFNLMDQHEIRVLDHGGVMVNPESVRIKWQNSNVLKWKRGFCYD